MCDVVLENKFEQQRSVTVGRLETEIARLEVCQRKH